MNLSLEIAAYDRNRDIRRRAATRALRARLRRERRATTGRGRR